MSAKNKRRLRSWQDRQRTIGFRFVLPFAVGSVLFVILPILKSLIYSFCELNVTSESFKLTFVGLKNYKWLVLIDPNYRINLLSSVTDMLVNVPVTILFSFFIASLLNQKFRGRGIARMILFLPVILSSGIYVQLSNVDSVSKMITSGTKVAGSGQATAFAKFLMELNINNDILNFLVSSAERISVIVSMSAIPIVIFLAGFQTVSPAIFEAAYIEGATKWETFWKISFPMVSSLILVCVVYTLVDSFTSTANPMINSIHNTIFSDFNFGIGNAMVWIYLAVVFIIIAVVYAVINRYIFYYD